jgi:farnesol dehydrogenase
MNLTSRIMLWQNSITGIPPAITPDFVKKYMVHWSLSSQKAVSELGYRITPFASGAKMTLEWLGQIKPDLKPLISQP